MHKILFCLLLCMVSVRALEWPADRRMVADSAVGLMINCQFAEAVRLADSLSATDTEEPLYPFLKLCALGLRNLDLDRICDSALFMQTYAATLARIDSAEKKARAPSSLTMTLRGFADASNASFLLFHKHYGQAVGTGLSSLHLLEKAKKIDAANYDADFFLGFYQYARGELKKRLGPLVFWLPGNRKAGLAQLNSCLSHAQIASRPAAMVLADVYTQEKDFAKARATWDALNAGHPDSRFLMWSSARFHEAQGDFSAAAAVYGRLAASYAAVPKGDYNMLATRLLQVEVLRKAGKGAEASKIAKQYGSCTACFGDPRSKALCRRLSQYAKERS